MHFEFRIGIALRASTFGFGFDFGQFPPKQPPLTRLEIPLLVVLKSDMLFQLICLVLTKLIAVVNKAKNFYKRIAT